MANKALFKSMAEKSKITPVDAVNKAGGVAYAMGPQHALAQYAATGCFNSTYYAEAAEQLEKVLELAMQVQPEFVAKCAVYARTKGHMKDMPALLSAVLSVRSPTLLKRVFDRVIDNPKMIRNFVQIMRSGAVGRKSLGSLPKRLVKQWIENRTEGQLIFASVGSDPSLNDLIRMVRPKPHDASRKALYAYFIDKEYDHNALPPNLRGFEKFKANPEVYPSTLPEVPMEMLTNLKLTKEQWTILARRVSWHSLRMNLNTFSRHGVFDNKGVVKEIAAKLANPEEISKARVFPYQLMNAYLNITEDVPHELREALQDAMEHAIVNVPTIEGKVWVFPDVSGSMQSPVTGTRVGSTSKVKCLDVASLVAAAVLRKNPSAGVLPFSDRLNDIKLNPRDSVMTNATLLAGLPSGGTDCSIPLEYLNKKGETGDLIIYVSDNESWIRGDGTQPPNAWIGRYGNRETNTRSEWNKFKRRNPKARMVCLDLQPNMTTQCQDREDILNVGGFSDVVFDIIAKFSAGSADGAHWVRAIESESI